MMSSGERTPMSTQATMPPRASPATPPARMIVHIGLGKTATTTIQRHLFARRARLLRESGVLYPAVATNHSGPLQALFATAPEELSFFRAQRLHDRTAVNRRVEAFREGFERAFDTTTAPTILLSGEGLASLPAERVAPFVDWLRRWRAEVVVVACLRAPAAWMASAAQQRVKRGWTLEELAAEPYLPDYRARLEPWLAAVGRKRLRVYDFARARRHEGGIVGAFLAQLDLPPDALGAPPRAPANESLCAEAVHLLSALNAARRGGAAPPQPHQPFELDAFRRLDGAPFRLDDATLERAEPAVRADLDWLAATLDFTFEDGFAPPGAGAGAAPELFGTASRRSLAELVAELNRQRGWRGIVGERGVQRLRQWSRRHHGLQYTRLGGSAKRLFRP
jgi:hypothetical protein